MLQCDIRRGQPRLKTDHQPSFEVSGLMALDGQASGLVVVSLARTVAIEATRFILGHASESIDSDVIDVVCEITNMVAGGANNRLGHLEMRIGLPSVVSGKNHIISYPAGVATISIPFDTDWGPLCVDASIKQVSGASNASTLRHTEESRTSTIGA